MSKVTISGNASGTGTLLIAAPNTNSDITLNLPTTMGTNNSSSVVTTDAAGNLGLGVTPSAWSQGKAFEISAVGEGLWGNGLGDIWMLNGAYFNGGFKYSGTIKATAYRQGAGVSDGSHSWHIAPSGTAGNAITFTQAMTLTAAGQLNLPGGFISAQGWQSNGSSFTSAASIYNGVYAPADNIIAITTVGTERARIDSSGNLLVGKTATSVTTVGSEISVNGFRTIANSGGAGYFYNQTSGTTGVVGLWRIANVDVGSITVNGSSTAYVTASDYRLKEAIAPMTGALAKVALLKPCTYKWKVDGSDGQGFIAHELAEVEPGCVVGEKDAVNEDGSIKPQGIDTSFLIATLTAAIQELHAIVAAQGEQIATLKGQA